MKTKKAIFFLFVFLSYIPVLAQVDTAWVRRYNGPGDSRDQATALAVDNTGNVYVTGDSYSLSFFGYATIKYAPNGDTLWVRRYDGPASGRDEATALAVDDSGNVYVTGSSSGDYATIKYASNGDTLWVRRYPGAGGGNALAVDDIGNVYVTGWSFGSGTERDYTTIKYASNGDTVWVRHFDGPLSGDDRATALAVDVAGNVYVTGYVLVDVDTELYFEDYDYATIKYSPDGDTLWVRSYNGPVSGWDEATALVLDDSGNVYVTGTTYLGYGCIDVFCFPINGEYTTIKYNSNGDTLWVRHYKESVNSDDRAGALAVDDSGNVYVTGYYATIKYGPNGDTLWVRQGSGNALAVDNSGNVYVTGSRSGNYATIKYAPNGDTVWVRTYNGPANLQDVSNALAVDNNGNVYVTGSIDYEYEVPPFHPGDYGTIKYIQFSCVAKPGDANGDGNILLPDIITIINFLFRAAPAPTPLCRGDANANGNVLLSDIVYLINFLFKSGPAPQKSRECCL